MKTVRTLLAALSVTATVTVAAATAAEPPPAFTIGQTGTIGQTATIGQTGDASLVGRIWEPAGGRWITPDQLMERAARADVVLLGETHDNPDHHALQAWVVRGLAAAGRRPGTAFEMIDTDQQSAVDAHLAAAGGDAAGLGAAVQWDTKGWLPWAHYRPIAEATLAAGGPVRAANLPRDLTRQIGKGAAPVEATARLGLDRPLPEAVTAAMADEIRASHCNMLPEAAVMPMVRVQRARDAEMAGVLANLRKERPGAAAVLIAGAGHVRSDRAVPAVLKAGQPALHTLAVAFIEVQKGADRPEDYAAHYGAATLPFDAVWFTPRTERGDPCEGFGQHMKKKAGK